MIQLLRREPGSRASPFTDLPSDVKDVSPESMGFSIFKNKTVSKYQGRKLMSARHSQVPTIKFEYCTIFCIQTFSIALFPTLLSGILVQDKGGMAGTME